MIGEALEPRDYWVDPMGNVHVNDEVITNVKLQWIEHAACHLLPPSAIDLFYRFDFEGLVQKVS